MKIEHFEILHHFADNLYIKEMRLPGGYSVGKHRHSFSHFSILTAGKVVLTVDGDDSLLVAPAIVTVKAAAEHTIRALSDSVWLCMHAVSEGDFDSNPEMVDAVILAKGK